MIKYLVMCELSTYDDFITGEYTGILHDSKLAAKQELKQALDYPGMFNAWIAEKEIETDYDKFSAMVDDIQHLTNNLDTIDNGNEFLARLKEITTAAEKLKDFTQKAIEDGTVEFY